MSCIDLSNFIKTGNSREEKPSIYPVLLKSKYYTSSLAHIYVSFSVLIINMRNGNNEEMLRM